jgi:hypothetical protein
MQDITFKKYYEWKNPRTLGDLAAEMGVSISYLSKLYHSHPTGTCNGPAWKKVSDYIYNDGFYLVKDNELDVATTKAMEMNELFKKEIISLDNDIALLLSQLENYAELKRIAKIIVANDERIKKIRKGGKRK